MMTDINKQALLDTDRIQAYLGADRDIPQVYIDGFRNIRAALTQPSAWQPIDTAPRDGTMFLAIKAEFLETLSPFGGYFCAYWNEGAKEFYYSRDRSCCNLSHWMPLPKPPVDVKGVK